MAKYSVTRSCGHTETVSLDGKVSERTRRLDWEATRTCLACYKDSAPPPKLTAIVYPPSQISPSRDDWQIRVRIAVINSYAVREQLKARGYRYETDAHWRDALGLKTVPGWVKEVETTDVLEDEDRALRALGAEIRVRNEAGAILMSLALAAEYSR